MVEIVANVNDGVALFSSNGDRLNLIAVDSGGNIHADGGELIANIAAAVIEMQKNFWAGRGHLTVVQKVGT